MKSRNSNGSNCNITFKVSSILINISHLSLHSSSDSYSQKEKLIGAGTRLYNHFGNRISYDSLKSNLIDAILDGSSDNFIPKSQKYRTHNKGVKCFFYNNSSI